MNAIFVFAIWIHMRLFGLLGEQFINLQCSCLFVFEYCVSHVKESNYFFFPLISNRLNWNKMTIDQFSIDVKSFLFQNWTIKQIELWIDWFYFLNGFVLNLFCVNLISIYFFQALYQMKWDTKCYVLDYVFHFKCVLLLL